jgi:RNA polymerase sigma factor (sigma-70 family)
MAGGSAAMLGSEDRLWLKRLNQGSKDALRWIYQEYRRELFTIAVSLLRDTHLAEDCLQDVFVRLAESAGRINVTSNLKAYLASCVVNRARDQIRRQAKRAGCAIEQLDCPADTPDASERLACDEQVAAILDAIAQLPCEQREAFVLHAQAGLSFRAIAASQNIGLRTIHSRYRYAVGRLRKLLKEGIRS